MVAALPARAQETPALDSLRLELWPEFDQPAVLIILAGTLAPATPLPAELTVRIPSRAGEPHAVAVADDAGSLLNAPYTTTSAGDETAVTIQLDRPNFHLEYYDTALAVEGQSRSYTFEWTAPWPVGDASLRVQEPAGAAGLAFDLPLAPSGPGEFGLNYHALALGPLAAGQVVRLQLDYARTTPGLSIEAGGAGFAVTPDLPAPPGPDVPAEAWWAAGGAAVAVAVGAGVLWFLRSREAPQPTGGGRRKRGRRSSRAEAGFVASEPAGSGAAFCAQCGQPFQPADRFCRNCGAPRRA
jgi:hypothetical protein